MNYISFKLIFNVRNVFFSLFVILSSSCNKNVESDNSKKINQKIIPRIDNSNDSLLIVDHINCGTIGNEGFFKYDENGKIYFQNGNSVYKSDGNFVYLYEDEVNVGVLECDGGVQEELKTVNWGDGNSYDYYYTENINFEDLNGEIIPITVYINNVPVNSDCKIKKCKWCNSIINLKNNYTEEFPNLDDFRKNPNRESMAQLITSLGVSIYNYVSVDKSSKKISIRTETNNICDYDEVHGYCSNKCYYEANH
jgi:hypothetical protein